MPEGDRTCPCNMFKNRGTCYHTGYDPRSDFYTVPPKPESLRAAAEVRRRAFLQLLRELNNGEDH